MIRMDIKAELGKLIKEHGKVAVRKACEEAFQRHSPRREQEWDEFAEGLLDRYPGDGIHHLAVKAIKKRLREGVARETLDEAVTRYWQKLRKDKLAGKKVSFDFVYRSHNFFGGKEYWRQFVQGGGKR